MKASPTSITASPDRWTRAHTPLPFSPRAAEANAAAPGRLSLPADPFPLAVRVDAAGNVLDHRGDAGDLAAAAAYVSQVAQLVGGELGLGRFMALHAVDGSQQIIIGADPGGETLAVCGPRHLASTALRSRLDV